ncbi:MAG: hypothetical protein Q8K58_13310 [Acidimicrobiales bacterium]|nr:hypothetical protein [Acidimicrobiales bacterium]
MAGKRLRPGVLLATALVLAPIVACSDDDPQRGEGRLEVDGAAVLERQEGDREVVSGQADVGVGDEITLREGSGTLTLPGGVTLELRQGLPGGVEDTRLLMGDTPELLAGDLLVVAPDGTAVTVGSSGVQVAGGAAQVSKPAGVEVSVAAYDTGVHIESGGQEREVIALREMQVPALGLPPDAPRPLQYEASDPWDRRFLGEAIDLGTRLEALAAGYTDNLARGQGRTVEFFRGVLPGLADEPDFTASLLDPDRPPGETLIGAAIADLGRRGSFLERWELVFRFRGEHAAWGLVARDQGVDSLPLTTAVTEAVNDSPLAIGPTRPTSGSTTPTTAPQRPPTATPPADPEPTTPTTRPPPTAPPPPDEDDGLLGPLVAPLEPVIEPIAEALGGLLSGLLGGLTGR